MGARKLAGTSASVIALLIAIAPSAAIAQESSASGYGGAGGGVQSELGGGGDGAEGAVGAELGEGGSGPAAAASKGTGEANGGSLPFTGLDLLLVGAGGLALIAAGAALGRWTPRARGIS